MRKEERVVLHFLSCFDPPRQFGVVNCADDGSDACRVAHFFGVMVLMASAWTPFFKFFSSASLTILCCSIKAIPSNFSETTIT